MSDRPQAPAHFGGEEGAGQGYAAIAIAGGSGGGRGVDGAVQSDIAAADQIDGAAIHREEHADEVDPLTALQRRRAISEFRQRGEVDACDAGDANVAGFEGDVGVAPVLWSRIEPSTFRSTLPLK